MNSSCLQGRFVDTANNLIGVRRDLFVKSFQTVEELLDGFCLCIDDRVEVGEEIGREGLGDL